MHLQSNTSAYRIVLVSGGCSTRKHLWGPVGRVPSNKLSSILALTAVQVSWRKGLKLGTFPNQALHLGPNIHRAVVAPTNVEGSDAHVVSNHEKEIVGLVVENEAEHTPKLAGQFDGGTKLGVHRQDDLAIRSSLGVVRSLKSVIELFVVVDFTVSSNDYGSVSGDERLRSTFGVHDRETFMSNAMGQRATTIGMRGDDLVTGPVRSAMTKSRGAADQLPAKFRFWQRGREDGEDPTHLRHKRAE